MVPEERVAWVKRRGIGHALSAEKYGWHITVCNIFTPSGEVVGRKAITRVCRKCRKVLRETILDPESQQTLRKRVQKRLQPKEQPEGEEG